MTWEERGLADFRLPLHSSWEVARSVRSGSVNGREAGGQGGMKEREVGYLCCPLLQKSGRLAAAATPEDDSSAWGPSLDSPRFPVSSCPSLLPQARWW